MSRIMTLDEMEREDPNVFKNLEPTKEELEREAAKWAKKMEELASLPDDPEEVEDAAEDPFEDEEEDGED